MSRPRLSGLSLPLGIVVVVLAVVGLEMRGAMVPPPTVLAGLGVLALGGWAGAGRGRLLAFAGAVPGAVLLAFGDYGGPSWIATAAVASTVVAAPLTADADREWARAGAVPLWYALSCVGLYACVPDTEEARVLVVVALAAAVLSRVPWLRTFGAPGSYAAVGLFVWIAAYDARGRPAAFIGAVGALGLLALEPVGRWVRARRAPLVSGSSAFLALLAVQAVLAASSSRIAGLAEQPRDALVRVLPVLIAGGVAGFVAGARRVRRVPRGPTAGTRPRDAT